LSPQQPSNRTVDFLTLVEGHTDVIVEIKKIHFWVFLHLFLYLKISIAQQLK
jgi:hypothetical protein